MLILPSHPDFYRILATPPPEPTKQKNFVVRAGGLVMEEVDDRQLDDYLEGGEYDEHTKDSDVLYLPVSIQV